jgi:protein arginine kinase
MTHSIRSHPLPSWLAEAGPESDVVISTRARLARNLAHHRFPRRASSFERGRVYTETAAAFKAVPGCERYDAVEFSEIDKRGRDFMVEEGSATAELASTDGGAAVLRDCRGRVNVLVNEDDHLRFTALESGLRTRDLAGDLQALDEAVGSRLDYAYDRRIGFLTSSPADAGTGFAVSFLLHLPALAFTRSLGRVLAGARHGGLYVREFPGTGRGGNLFLISLSRAHGHGGPDPVDAAAAVVKQAAWLERKARERILADGRDELEERMRRSWDVLLRSKRLSVEDFFEHGSSLRLGIECNVFVGCTLDDLNRLSLFVLPAHLETYHRGSLDIREAGEARAELVRNFLSRNVQEDVPHENG